MADNACLMGKYALLWNKRHCFTEQRSSSVYDAHSISRVDIKEGVDADISNDSGSLTFSDNNLGKESAMLSELFRYLTLNMYGCKQWLLT